MPTLYLAAAVIAVLTGVVHSVLGEWLIFRHLRDGGLVPRRGAPPLRERHVRILWATWHLATVFGWAFARVLLRMGMGQPLSVRLVSGAMVSAYLGGAVLVLVGTRGRHPGWVALGAVAALTAAAAAST
ncbi:hypothetical protein [Ideonella sp.]|uniref:hypothetical protein n=1 Tax=Ideonella sp. TaxID=1929293 RepID=UPI0035B1BDA1